MKGVSKKKHFQVIARRNRVAEEYLRGTPQFVIAQREKVDPSQITRDLEAVQEEWLRSSIQKLDAAKAKELARLDLVEREAWRGWERSEQDRQRTTKERIEAGGPAASGKKANQAGSNRAKVSVQTEGRLPENEYLRTVLTCVNKRCEILGINAPRKVAPTDPTGEQEYVGRPTIEQRMGLLREMVAEFRRETGQAGTDHRGTGGALVEAAGGPANLGLPEPS
jgi:hypothetical protein